MRLSTRSRWIWILKYGMLLCPIAVDSEVCEVFDCTCHPNNSSKTATEALYCCFSIVYWLIIWIIIMTVASVEIYVNTYLLSQHSIRKRGIKYEGVQVSYWIIYDSKLITGDAENDGVINQKRTKWWYDDMMTFTMHSSIAYITASGYVFVAQLYCSSAS